MSSVTHALSLSRSERKALTNVLRTVSQWMLCRPFDRDLSGWHSFVGRTLVCILTSKPKKLSRSLSTLMLSSIFFRSCSFWYISWSSSELSTTLFCSSSSENIIFAYNTSDVEEHFKNLPTWWLQISISYKWMNRYMNLDTGASNSQHSRVCVGI